MLYDVVVGLLQIQPWSGFSARLSTAEFVHQELQHARGAGQRLIDHMLDDRGTFTDFAVATIFVDINDLI